MESKPEEKLGVIAVIMLAISLVCLAVSIFEYVGRLNRDGWDNPYFGTIVIFTFTTIYLAYGLHRGE